MKAHSSTVGVSWQNEMTVSGSVDGRKWEAIYVKPGRYAFKEIRVESAEGNFLPPIRPSDRGYDSLDELRADAERIATGIVRGAG